MMQSTPLFYSNSSMAACLTLGKKWKPYMFYRYNSQLPFRAHLLFSLLCDSLSSLLCHKYSRHIATSRPLSAFVPSARNVLSPQSYIAFPLTSFRPILKVTLSASHCLFSLLRDGKMGQIKLRSNSEKWKQI